MSKYTFEDYAAFADSNPWLWECDLLTGRTKTPATNDEIRKAEDILGFKFQKHCLLLLNAYGFIPFFHYSTDFFNLPPDYNCIHTEMFYNENSEINKRRDTDTNATLYNIVTYTLGARELCKLPNNYLVIWEEEGDELGCVDMQSNDGTVIVWDFFAHVVNRVVNNSFIDFLFLNYIEEGLDYVMDPRNRFCPKTNKEYDFIWPDSLKNKLKEDFLWFKTNRIFYSNVQLPNWL